MKILLIIFGLFVLFLIPGCYIYTNEPPPPPAVIITPESPPPPPSLSPPAGAVGPAP